MNNLNFYNDAKSTNIAATVAALSSFSSPNNLSLILGGQLRDGEVEIKDEYDFSSLKNIFVFGEAARKIEKNLDLNNINVMSSIFETEKEGDVLFSPAFPSFDQYENYEFRGVHFSELVQKRVKELG